MKTKCLHSHPIRKIVFLALPALIVGLCLVPLLGWSPRVAAYSPLYADSRQPVSSPQPGNPAVLPQLNDAPGVDSFDLEAWLSQNAPAAARCSVPVNGETYPLQDALTSIARTSGIDARLLLVLAEVERAALTHPGERCEVLVSFGDTLLAAAQQMNADSYFYHFSTPYTGLPTDLRMQERRALYSNETAFAIAGAAIGAADRTKGDAGTIELALYDLYGKWFSAPQTHPSLADAQAAYVEYKLPFAGRKPYTGGPHSEESTAPCAEVSGVASGLDFGNNSANIYNQAVMAIAPGKVVGVKQDTSAPGKWVAIRHDDGLVSMYWHLDNIYVAQDEEISTAGVIIGEMGATGCAGCSEHIHLELRRGECEYKDWNSRCQPVSWYARVLQDWQFFPELYASGRGVNYYGTAILGTGNWQFVTGKNISACGRTVQAFVDDTFTGDREIQTAYTKFADANGGAMMDSNNYPYCPARMAGAPLASEDLCGGGVSTPTPGPTPTRGPTATPRPSTSCPADGRAGVYLFENQNYTGDCTYTTSNIPDLGATGVGNDRMSSARLVGSWRVKLYEDRYYGGRFDSLSSSVSNLDVRSLGDQYSSVSVEANTGNCPTDGRAGIYFYMGRNYTDRCHYAVSDVNDFGATVLGNDSLSSVRIIGDWTIRIYEDRDLQGRYDELSHDEPNLDIRSLGDQYSSARVRAHPPTPTPTATDVPGPGSYSVTLLAPDVNNGGFETGSMSGWQTTGGSFTIDAETPRSGRYYNKGSGGNPASYYREWSLDSHIERIRLGTAQAAFSGWFHDGSNEQHLLELTFYNQAGAVLWRSNLGWQAFRSSGYQQSGATVPIPTDAQRVRFEVFITRGAHDFTDADSDDMFLRLDLPAAAPPPSATPQPTPNPKDFSLVINNQSLYTNETGISLEMNNGGRQQMRVSQSGAFQNSGWQAARTNLSWNIPTNHDRNHPFVLFAWFKDSQGRIMGPVSDAIGYDDREPFGRIGAAAIPDGGVMLTVSAGDSISGVEQMRIGNSLSLEASPWQPYENQVRLAGVLRTIYVQFKDLAGNISPAFGTDGTVNGQTYHYLFLPAALR